MVGSRPINALAIFILVSFASGTAFAPLEDWKLFRQSDSDSMMQIIGSTMDSIAASDSSSMDGITTCNSVKVDGISYKLELDYSFLVNGLTEWTIGVWAYYESTISSQVFQFGPDSGKHYIFSSDTDGTIKGSYYTDETTTDSSNDFTIKVPLNKWFFIAFDFVNNAGTVTLNILVNGVASYAKTSVGGSSVPFEMPDGKFYFGKSVTAKFYYLVLTNTATMSADTKLVTLTDAVSNSLDIAIPCSGSCGDVSCLSNNKCLAWKQYCTSCTSESCNTCDPNSSRDSADYCQSCTSGTTIQNGNCCANANNCVGCSTSSTVCDLCPAGNFLYKQSGTSTSCISCTDSCDQCLPGPSCYECADSVVQDGSTCRVDKIGLQVSFDTPNIVIDFANPLSTGLTESSFTAAANDQTDIPTTSWTFTGCTAGSIQCTIAAPNVLESQLPLSLDIEFAKA